MRTPIITEERRIGTLGYKGNKIQLYIGTYIPNPLAECFCDDQKDNKSIHIDRRAVDSFDDDALICCIIHEIGHIVSNTIDIPKWIKESDEWFSEAMAWTIASDIVGKRPVIDTLSFLIKRASTNECLKYRVQSLKINKAFIIIRVPHKDTDDDYDNKITFESVDKPGIINQVVITHHLDDNDTTLAEKIFARTVIASFGRNEKRKFNQMEV